MPATSVTGALDADFAPYRDFYTRRVQRLERFKKARTFCCVVSDDEPGIASLPPLSPPPPPPPPTSPPSVGSATTLDAKFNELRQKMVSIYRLCVCVVCVCFGRYSRVFSVEKRRAICPLRTDLCDRLRVG